jgi:hypothetical protein
MAQFFDTPDDLRVGFAEHHETTPELFVGYWKKGAGARGISHSEAIEQALCFGWIDWVARRLDEQRYQVRFTRDAPAPGLSNYASPTRWAFRRTDSPKPLNSSQSRRPGFKPTWSRPALYS